MQKLYDDKVN